MQLVCDNLEGGLELGQTLEVRIRSTGPIETRCFLTHRPVTYLQALAGGWSRRESVTLGPEAPGDYTLCVAWRDEGGQEGWETLEFRVREPRTQWAGLRRWLSKTWSRFHRSPVPVHRVRAAGIVGRLVGPSMFEVGHLADSEPGMDVLAEVIRSGDVVFDVGANLGLYTIVMAQLAGPSGRVYCFEANPICVSYLRLNLALNRLENVHILPVALLDHAGETPFTVNYGNASLGAAADSSFFRAKLGQEIRVECAALDELIDKIGLPAPDFVKIDVEGTESRVLTGMRRVLREHRPRLHLELHGEESVRDSLAVLDSCDYEYRLASSAEKTASLRELRDGSVAPTVIQILAQTRISPNPESANKNYGDRRPVTCGTDRVT